MHVTAVRSLWKQRTVFSGKSQGQSALLGNFTDITSLDITACSKVVTQTVFRMRRQTDNPRQL